MKCIDPLNKFNLTAFYAGDKHIIEEIYRQYVPNLERSIIRYCHGVDAESVIHDLFVSLLKSREIRQQFQGGSMGAWLTTFAKHRAIDQARRSRRLTSFEENEAVQTMLDEANTEDTLLQADRREKLERALACFSQDILPGLDVKLHDVFRVRFLEKLSQVAAAKQLELSRTTLINRENRLLKPLEKFLKNQ